MTWACTQQRFRNKMIARNTNLPCDQHPLLSPTIDFAAQILQARLRIQLPAACIRLGLSFWRLYCLYGAI